MKEVRLLFFVIDVTVRELRSPPLIISFFFDGRDLINNAFYSNPIETMILYSSVG
jgi:hypothetical protein